MKVEHNRMHKFASQGVEMSSQGENYKTLKTSMCHLQARNERLCEKVLKYKERFGELSDKSGKSILADWGDII